MKNIKNLLHVLLICIGLLSLNAQAGIEITYIHNDALGSPVAGTDEQGTVKWRSHYQPYGEERLGERQLFGVRSGYTGHREDPETGLTYMGARYYSPVIGRFMGVDPAGVSESNIHSFNRYAYANNNPYKYVDPDGSVAIIPIIIWAGGAAAFIGDVFFPGPAQLDEHGDAPLQSVSTLPGPLGTFKKTANVAKGAADRAKQVHSVLDPRAQRARTTAVTETKEGIRVISSSERRLAPGQRAQLGKNEIEGVGVGHAEVTGVNAARNSGLTPTGTAASRPICSNCAGFLKDQGVNPLSP